jgi:hypothetical protein
MTREELANNFSFKSSVKALKKKFPYIKDVVPGKDFENDLEVYDSFYVVDLIIDGDKFFELYPNYYEAMWPMFRKEYEKNKKIKLSFSEFYTYDENENLDLSADELRNDIMQIMDKQIKNIRNSGIVPEEMHLDRYLYPGHLFFEK